jgi:hypothetical protein
MIRNRRSSAMHSDLSHITENSGDAVGASPAALPATLRIYTKRSARDAEFPWAWLDALRRACRRGGERTPVRLTIVDLAGREMLSTEDGGPLTVPLPAGTYHVAVHANAVSRRYTFTLAPGALCDLHVDLAPARALTVTD